MTILVTTTNSNVTLVGEVKVLDKPPGPDRESHAGVGVIMRVIVHPIETEIDRIDQGLAVATTTQGDIIVRTMQLDVEITKGQIPRIGPGDTITRQRKENAKDEIGKTTNEASTIYWKHHASFPSSSMCSLTYKNFSNHATVAENASSLALFADGLERSARTPKPCPTPSPV